MSRGTALLLMGFLNIAASFLTLLKGRNYEGLEIKSDIIPGETHISSWPASLTLGLKYLYEK